MCKFTSDVGSHDPIRFRNLQQFSMFMTGFSGWPGEALECCSFTSTWLSPCHFLVQLFACLALHQLALQAVRRGGMDGTSLPLPSWGRGLLPAPALPKMFAHLCKLRPLLRASEGTASQSSVFHLEKSAPPRDPCRNPGPKSQGTQQQIPP